jgi:ribosomal protein S11
VECAGAVAQGNACVTGSVVGFGGPNYNTALMQGAKNGSTAPSAYSGYSPTSTAAGNSITDSGGVTFAMIADTTATKNYWGTNNVNNMLTIPVGVFDVTDVSTMLNDEYGAANAQNTTVFFNFGATSNATTGLTVLEVQLTNANTYASATSSGQIRSTATCTTPGTSAHCASLAGGSLAGTSNATAITITGTNQNNALADSGTTGTVQVKTSTAYTGFTYTSAASTSQEFFGSTAGTVQLDAQDFEFGSAFAGLYLVSIGVNENSYSLPPTGGNSTASVTALSGITVDTDAPALPEPSTWVLFLGGIAVIGFGRLRRLTN